MSVSLLKPGKMVPITMGASRAGWHAIESFIRCPKEYQFAAVRKVVPVNVSVPEPLSVGIHLHAARAQALNDGLRGELWRDAMKLAERMHAEAGTPLFPGAIDTATRTFEAWLAFWKLRPRTTVLAVEYELEPRPLAPNAPPWATRGARLDSIEKDPLTGAVWIGEFKSTYDSGSAVSDLYSLHGQVLLQAALWGPEETKKFGTLAGILLDVVKKPRGDERAKAYPRMRLPLHTFAHALRWFRKDFTGWLMQTHLIDWNAAPERRPVCVRKYGPCDFRELCLDGRNGSLKYRLADGRRLVDWKPTPDQRTPPWE